MGEEGVSKKMCVCCVYVVQKYDIVYVSVIITVLATPKRPVPHLHFCTHSKNTVLKRGAEERRERKIADAFPSSHQMIYLMCNDIFPMCKINKYKRLFLITVVKEFCP